jgi:hypothetical protein
MQELLFGSWGPQITAFTKQNPLQVLSVALTAVSIVLTLLLGVRGFGSDDAGGCSFGDGDGDGGGCGGD